MGGYGDCLTTAWLRDRMVATIFKVELALGQQMCENIIIYWRRVRSAVCSDVTRDVQAPCSAVQVLCKWRVQGPCSYLRADTLYLCYCIDEEIGEKKREDVFIAVRFSSYTTLILCQWSWNPIFYSNSNLNNETEICNNSQHIIVISTHWRSINLRVDATYHRHIAASLLHSWLQVTRDFNLKLCCRLRLCVFINNK
jgi:hypothetical protein